MSRRTTIKDVAVAAGVAVVTVSRVVNTPDQVQADTRTRVLEAMRRLGYSPNLAARSMRTQFTRSIGFLTPELSSPTNAAVAQACEQALAEAGYAMLVTSSGHRPEREIAALALLRARGVDGIVLYVSDESHAGLARALAALDIPLVVLDRSLPVHADRVLSDHAGAMTQAVQHLATLGHERMALVRHRQQIRPGLEREQAFRQAMKRLRLAPARVLRVPREAAAVLDDTLFTAADAPTALIAEGTRLLRLTLLGLRQHGLQVPKDSSVIGIDTLDVSDLTTPETTTIARDFHAIGRAAAEMMVRRLADPQLPPQLLLLDSRLELRGSCEAPARLSHAPPRRRH